MKYSIGDKVRIVNKWGDGCYENYEGKMDKWLGKVMTIREVDEEGEWYKMEEDGEEFTDGWHWYEPSIAELVEKKEPKEPKELEKNNLHVGDRVRRKIMECEGFCKVGETGTILTIDNSDCPIFVQWDNGRTSWNCKCYLEHAAEGDRQNDSGNTSKEDAISTIIAALRGKPQSQVVEIVDTVMDFFETYCWDLQ